MAERRQGAHDLVARAHRCGQERRSYRSAAAAGFVEGNLQPRDAVDARHELGDGRQAPLQRERVCELVVVLDGLLSVIERRLLKWRPEVEAKSVGA